jgi:hypothetical protein
MSKKITGIYLVPKGQPKGNNNLRRKIGPEIIPIFVKSGDTFITDHHKIGIDTFPGIQKDLILDIEETIDGVTTKIEKGFSENVSSKRTITVKIP